LLQLDICSILVELNRLSEASEQIELVINHCREQNCDPICNNVLYFSAGNIYFKMKEYESSLNCLKIFLGVAISININAWKKYHLMICYSGIGICLLNLDQHEEPLFYLKTAVKMITECHISKDLFDDDDDELVTVAFYRVTTYHSIEKCLMKLQQYKEAFQYLNQALELRKTEIMNKDNQSTFAKLTGLEYKSPSLKRKLQELARIFLDVGKWYKKQNCFNEAENFLQKALNLHNRFSEADEIASARVKLLTFYMESYQKQKVLTKNA